MGRRRLLSLFLVFHLVAMAASLGKRTAAGEAVRTVTAPYERLLGIWQSWGMFAPVPPMGTSWMRATGVTAGGTEIALPTLVGDLPRDRTDMHYRRLLKVERSMFDSEAEPLRRHFALWLCGRSREQGMPFAHVRTWKEHVSTPRPSAAPVPWEVRPVRRVEYEAVECP